MYDMIIIGAGPAGMTAALYALRANQKVLILEAKSYGGQIVNAHKIENYPGISTITGFEFATALYEQIQHLGVEIRYETVIRIGENRTVITNQNQYQARAIIIATGAENRKLGIAKESQFVGKGVSYCATCDGHFYQGKEVAVVGSSSVALEDAIYLADLVKKVYLISDKDGFEEKSLLTERVQNHSQIEILWHTQVIGFNGENKLQSMTIKEATGEERVLEISGVFIAVGQSPKNEIFANLIQLDEKGYIIAKEDVYTNVPGIYVAGDARRKTLRQLATAVGDGALAATTAILEMKKEEKR